MQLYDILETKMTYAEKIIIVFTFVGVEWVVAAKEYSGAMFNI